MLRPLALVGAAVCTACAGAAPDVFSSTRPLLAPFLADEPTDYLAQLDDAEREAARAPAARTAPVTSAGPAIAAVVRAAAAPGASGSLLLLRGGADTVLVEHAAHDGRTARVRMARRSGLVVEYALTARADGSAERFEASIAPPGATGATERFTARFSGDSVHSRTVRGTSAFDGAARVPADVLTYIDPSPVMLEQMVRRARHDGLAVTRIWVLVLGEPSEVMPGLVAFHGRDSAVVSFGDAVHRLKVDAEGRVLGGHLPEHGLTIERVDLGAARRP